MGGTPLCRGLSTSDTPEPDGVRRVSNSCIELETYANYVQRGAAGSIGMTIIISFTTSIAAAFGIGVDNLDRETLIAIFAWLPALTVLACIFYLAGGCVQKSRRLHSHPSRHSQTLFHLSKGKAPSRLGLGST